MKIEFAFVPGVGRRAIAVVVSVHRHVLTNASERERVRHTLSGITEFGGLPIVLATSEGQRIRYQGDRHLVSQLARIDARALPWRTATIRS